MTGKGIVIQDNPATLEQIVVPVVLGLTPVAPAPVDARAKAKEIVDDVVDLSKSDGIMQLAASAGKTAGTSRRLSWANQVEKDEEV